MPARSRTLSVFSIPLVAILVALVAYQLFIQATNRTEVGSLIRRSELEDSLMVEFAFTNNEGGKFNFTYYFYINDGLMRTETALLSAGDKIIFGANINTTRTPVSTVRFIVYKNGDPKPVQDNVQYVGSGAPG